MYMVANSGIDMDQQLIGLLCTYGAKVTLLVPEASKSELFIFHYPDMLNHGKSGICHRKRMHAGIESPWVWKTL